MKNTTTLLAIFFVLFSTTAFSQEDENRDSSALAEATVNKKEKIEQLEAQKEVVREAEKEKLKKTIARIDKRVEKGEIGTAESEVLKKEAIAKHEQNIADQLKMIDLNIALIKRNENSDDYDEFGNSLFCATHDHSEDNEDGAFYVGVGANFPLSQSGELDPYQSLGWSFDLGILIGEFQLSPENEKLSLKPGFAIQFLTLPLEDNRVLTDENGSTNVALFPKDLEYSRFNLWYLNFPVHLEYRLENDFNLGLGGFFGFKLLSSQEYEYNPGNKFLHLTKHRSFNTNNFRYGADAYFGWKDLKLRVRYYINPVFGESNANVGNLSVGVLFGY